MGPVREGRPHACRCDAVISFSLTTAASGWCNRSRIVTALVHARRADRTGNVQIWGIAGVQKEAVLAADRALVTVEEVVDELEPRPGDVVIPGWAVDRVAAVPGGAAPARRRTWRSRSRA